MHSKQKLSSYTSRIIYSHSSSLLFISYYYFYYVVCLPLMLVNKVDHLSLFVI